MNERTTTMDRPWKNEPNRLEWRHAGRPCLIVRNRMGALCGYVGVPVERAEDVALRSRLDDLAHGGLTFGPEPCHEGGDICHVPLPGEAEVMWYGFDCSHAYDVVPYFVDPPDGMPRMSLAFHHGEKYRDIEYVKAIVNRMAEAVDQGGTSAVSQPATSRST